MPKKTYAKDTAQARTWEQKCGGKHGWGAEPRRFYMKQNAPLRGGLMCTSSSSILMRQYGGQAVKLVERHEALAVGYRVAAEVVEAERASCSAGTRSS